MKHNRKRDAVRFFNIPRDWTYLIGFEYTKINRRGETKLTKGQKPITGRIDHLDLFLLDEIRGFKERGNAECFKEALSLAVDLGIPGGEQNICDRVLQLCGLGLVRAKRKPVMGGGIPRLVLEVDQNLLDDMIEARRESALLQQGMDSRQEDFRRLVKKSHLLQEYLQEYLQKSGKEYPQENPEEPSKEPGEEYSQTGPRAAVRTRPVEKDFYVLDSLEDDGSQQYRTEISSSTSIEYEETDSPHQQTDNHSSTGLNDMAEDSISDIYGEQVCKAEQVTSASNEEPSYEWVLGHLRGDHPKIRYGADDVENMKQQAIALHGFSETYIDGLFEAVVGKKKSKNQLVHYYDLYRMGTSLRILMEVPKDCEPEALSLNDLPF